MANKLENLLAITGLPGIYRMKANRSNGLIVEAPVHSPGIRSHLYRK